MIFRGQLKGSFATVEGERMDDLLLRLGTYGPVTSFKLLWIPKNCVSDERNYRGPFHVERVSSPQRRSNTPTPRPEPSQDHDAPAWNLHDSTYSAYRWSQEQASAEVLGCSTVLSNGHATNAPSHWALDSAFSHTVFRVIIKPFVTNEVPVFQEITADDGLVLVRQFRREQRAVDMRDIVWKHPKPRETGRMIVIVSLHKGSYVRPI